MSISSSVPGLGTIETCQDPSRFQASGPIETCQGPRRFQAFGPIETCQGPRRFQAFGPIETCQDPRRFQSSGPIETCQDPCRFQTSGPLCIPCALWVEGREVLCVDRGLKRFSGFFDFWDGSDHIFYVFRVHFEYISSTFSLK